METERGRLIATRFCLFVTLVLCFACQDESANPPNEVEQFVRFSGNPVFRDDIPNENYEAASDPHVFFDADGQRWMIYTGDPDENPGSAGIKLAQGTSWTAWEEQASLLFETGPSGLDQNKETPFYRKSSSGKHQIYYIGYPDGETYEAQLFLAESDQLQGPYQQQATPIVARGLIAEKEVEVITSPSVVAHNGELYLFFLGWDGFEDVTTVWVLGATSADDGQTWTDFREVAVPIGMEGQITPTPDGGFCAVRTGEYQGREAILYATASHPLGPWTEQEHPLLIKRDDDPLEVSEAIAPQITFDPLSDEPILYFTGADHQKGWWVMIARPKEWF